MQSSSKIIAVAFDLNFRHATQIFSGVLEHLAAQQPTWRLVPLNYGFETQLMNLAASGQLDAAIGSFVSDSWLAGLKTRGIAAVNLFNFSKIQSVPTVSFDDYALGASAARHLVIQGCRKFIFHGSNRSYSSQLRCDGFRKNMPGLFFEVQTGGDKRGLIELLRGGGAGVFCASDRIARDLILEGRREGLVCGKDFLVVGVDDDPAESIFAGVGLSSFRVPAKEVGRAAAAILESILEGASSENKVLTVGEPELIARESSLASHRARIAQLAVNWIQEQLASPELEMEGLARSLGVSRRLMEIAFSEQNGVSPYRYATLIRLEEAKRLLRTTGLTIAEIGCRCGYPEPHHFSSWFRSQSGMAPRTFRKAT